MISRFIIGAILMKQTRRGISKIERWLQIASPEKLGGGVPDFIIFALKTTRRKKMENKKPGPDINFMRHFGL